MANKVKAKKRLSKLIGKRSKEIERKRVDENFRNIFVKAGILKDK